MYKILNSQGLGVAGKQNELIELALTHGFDGVEVDMVDLIGRHDTLGKQFACQFLQSAKIDMGTFQLPIDLGAADEQYNASLEKIPTILDLATTLNAKSCYVEIAPNNADFSFQENFEKHQSRLQDLSEKFGDLKIGLYLKATQQEPADGEFKFIHAAEELLTLVKAVGQPNVGICLDAWQWVVGGGTVEQLTEAGFASTVTEVRLADVAAGANLKEIKTSERTALPGNEENSFSVAMSKAVIETKAEIPISVSTDLSTFTGGSRDNVVSQLSKQLDLLIAGEDPFAIQQAANAEAEAAEGEETAVAAAE